MKSNLTDDLRIAMGGKRPEDIYVIVSADGSTCVRDPGLGRPWSSVNQKIAEHHAKQIGKGCKVVTLDVAIKSILYHQKNLPKNMPKGYQLPDAPK